MSNQPLYRQIATQIRDQIQRGEIKTGDALPTELRLREQFGVSRVTVRQAIKLLVEQDVLESVQGSGTYVKEAKVNYDIYQLTSFDEKLQPLDRPSHSEVLAFSILKPPIGIAEALALSEQARVYYIKRLRFIVSKPVTLEETWMPLELFPDLTYEVMQGSKYAWMEQTKHLVIDRSEQEIIPLMPTKEMVSLLGVAADQPILQKISKGFLADGTVFEFSRNTFRTDDYKFTLIARRMPH
ncbi:MULTISPECIES: GntR family transcriptional regulator [Rahnella]|uniref:GntR family transcriptional regulator n=1 Tax=Rahnella TaxID=34037 RepID=UPI00216A5A58|nr:GntR family transcriptional regulator [Rahnella sp. BIGb0603]MCS3425327.1 GntR family mannosyl-D-glycerate transport/metabolism transcriptional repressor [Rahnella sp. BIGb0603]MDF1896784.1 GntR family transcriptional regulator [Rahnella contaminans]